MQQRLLNEPIESVQICGVVEYNNYVKQRCTLDTVTVLCRGWKPKLFVILYEILN